jgi:RimJ/RimL family protein N-acetyltransferase
MCGVIRKWRNMPEIYEWCRQDNLISDAEQGRWFDNQNQDKSIRMYSVQAKSKEGDPKLIGVCGLTDIDLVNRRAEFSLYIAPFLHGIGLGETALKLLLGRGFDDLGLNVIWGETFRGNKALKMFERVGFKVEGWRRDFYFKQGAFLDAALVSMTREEWYGDEP